MDDSGLWCDEAEDGLPQKKGGEYPREVKTEYEHTRGTSG